MFERNISMKDVETTRVSVILTLVSGREIAGHVGVAKALDLAAMFNRPDPFIEFETLDGDVIFYNKAELRAIKPVNAPPANQLKRPLRDYSSFDPYTTLGIEKTASPDAIRIAYIGLARTYHPDRFAGIDMPREMQSYIDAMAKRINMAYHQLTSRDIAANQA